MKVALHIIVRNEADNLPGCLESVRGIFDEAIIVDTGSTDDTVKIARRFGARVLRFDWCDDFSAARNYGLDRAQADYVFRMDADDRLMPGHGKRLRRLLDALDPRHPACWFARVHSVEGPTETTIDEHRLWPHLPELRFRGAVHERIRPERDAPHLPTYLSRVAIRHHGYDGHDLVAGKLMRNLRILEGEIAKGPVEPIVLFDLGRTYAGVGKHDEALTSLRAFLERAEPAHELASRIAHRRVVEIHRSRRDYRAAIEAAQAGLKAHPRDAQLCCWVANLMEACGNPELAREGYERALALYDPAVPDAGMPTDFVTQVKRAIDRLPEPAGAAS